jgi:hypothetical protein
MIDEVPGNGNPARGVRSRREKSLLQGDGDVGRDRRVLAVANADDHDVPLLHTGVLEVQLGLEPDLAGEGRAADGRPA